MMWHIVLMLPNSPSSRLGTVDADDAVDAARQAIAQWPLLPPWHTLVQSDDEQSDGSPRVVLLLWDGIKLKPTGPTPGQVAWAAERKRRRHAKRWQRHWAEKAG